MRLYEIAGELRRLVECCVDGELSPEQCAQLEALGLALDAKVDGCCGLIREWEAEIAARQAEIDRLKLGIATRQNSIRRLKDYMRDSLTTINQQRHQTALFTVWRQANPTSANCVGEPEQLDRAYQRIKIEADCQAALAYWKEHNECPRGFEIKQGEHLRIK
jgi:Gp157 protein